jgi:hypothetical protein
VNAPHVENLEMYAPGIPVALALTVATEDLAPDAVVAEIERRDREAATELSAQAQASLAET